MAMLQGWRKSGNDRFKIQRTKEKLLEELSKSVKELQKHALNGGCFDISRNDESAFYLTNVLEAIFLHGHQSSISVSGIFSKSSSSGALPSPNFWSILHPFTHKDVLHQLNHLSHISTLVGKCRAWLRLALNDCLMESYFHAILLDKKKLSHHYSPKAFLRDDEATSIMLNHFLGLIEFHFDLNYNTPSLNQWAVPALQLSGTWEPPTVPSATVATHSAGVRRPLSVHKAAIQSNPKAPAPSLTRSPKEQTLSDEMASYTSDTVMDYSGPEDENVKDKSAVDIDTTRTHGEKDFAKQNQPDNLGASPAIEACTTPSPVNHRGGNMLSMASGWSSSFEEEPSDQTAAAHVKNPAPDSEAKPMKPVMSFHGILSDYAMTGSKKFGSKGLATHLYSSPEEQDSLQEIDQSYCKEAFAPEKSSGFEIIADYSTPEEGYLNQRNVALLASVNDIPREKGLDRQDYKCKGCSRPIGMIYGQFKVCSYDGSYYCYECHVDDEHVIPARIIHNWDLTKYKVAKHVKLFLMQIDEEPLFHIDEVNPTLYNVISEINKAKHLRIQLQHLKGYVMTCRNTMVAEDVKRRMWPREYLWDDIHQYSLLDLIQVNSGLLQHHLKKIISFCKKHVYGCEVCSQKGFICEICKNSKIVYAFELNYTAQCPRCKAVFHKFCKVDRQCPRCTRRRSRRQPPEDATTENGHYNPGLNSLF